jgi:hypothetical protein
MRRRRGRRVKGQGINIMARKQREKKGECKERKYREKKTKSEKKE